MATTIARLPCLTFTACALLRAPDHAEHFVDVERDHTSDLPEGYLTPWRICQPFKGCCARQRRPRRQCEQRVVRIEAGYNRS